MTEHQIPTMNIYGEGDEAATVDQLHCEALITRSKAHKFTIRPHRHHGLSQIFYVKSGSAQAHFDGDPTTLNAPCIVVISQMCVHDFIWSKDVSGTVLSIANSMLEGLVKVGGNNPSIIQSTLIMSVNKDQTQLESLLELIQHEYNQPVEQGRSLTLKSLMQLLSVWLERNAKEHHFSNNRQDKKAEYLSRFNTLINRDFAIQRNVESYAKELGITAPYLNNLCQKLLQSSALNLVHERLLLEAKRYLIYTVMSMDEIAYALGFKDPAYFNRFFKRLIGKTPKQFRTLSNRGDIDRFSD